MRMQHHTVARSLPPPAAAQAVAGRVTLHVRSLADIEAVILAAKSGRSVDVVVVGSDELASDLLEAVTGELRRVGPGVQVLESAPPETAARSLDEQAQSLLDLLADGMTVAQAARRLGLSSRTATRRIEAARQHFGVASTAEAIVASRAVRADALADDARPGLVGRDDLLAQVCELLRRDVSVLLVGEGAVGKTALMDAIAAADGRAVHSSGGLETMAWRDQWAIRDAVRLPWDEDDADALAVRVEAVVGPDLLVMDDLHLTDAGSRRVLSALADRVAILAATRPDDEAVSQISAAGFVRIDVPPLPEEAMAELVRSLRPQARPGDVTDIVSRAGGLPLLAEFLCQGAPGMGIGRGLAPTVDALPGDLAREALLLALADRAVPASVTTPALVDAGIAVSGADGVRIRHALVADAVLARALAQDVSNACRLLADHALGLGDAGSAARYQLAAGDGEQAEAIALQAARSAPTGAERAQLLSLAARAAWAQGRGELAADALMALSASGRHADVLSLAQEIPPVDSAAEAVYALTRARAHWHVGDSAAAVAQARQGLAQGGALDPEVEAALLRETVRCELLSLGPQPDHSGLLERADLLVRTIGRGRAAQLTVAGLHAYFAGGPANELWEQGRAVAESEGDIDSLMRCSNNLISWNEGDGDPDAALLLSEQMVDVAASHGLGEWRAQFMAMAANLHFHQGTYPAALALLDDIDAAVVDGQTRQQADGTRLAILIDLGLLEEAERLLPSPLDVESRDWLRDDTVAYLRAAHAYWSGDLRAALDLAAPLLDLTGGAILVWFPRSLRAWAQYDMQEQVDVPTGGPSVRIVAGVVREIEAIRLLQIDPVVAVEVFDEAAAVGRHGSYALALRAAWGAGEAARLGNVDGAIDRLLGVEKLCVEAGLEPLLAKVHRSLRLAGVRRTARRAPDRSGLMTERERLVLELAARGATYDEIARRLGVGRSTVRRLLDSARLRLGASGKFAAVASLPGD